MTDNTSENTPVTPQLPEHKIDALLSDFFRNEVPTGLGEGQLDWESQSSDDQIASSRPVASPERSRQRWQRQLAAAIGIATVAVCGLLMVNPLTEDDPVADGTTNAPQVDTGEDMMLVSPGAGQPEADATVVGDHGLTIGETDDIDLSPSGEDR